MRKFVSSNLVFIAVSGLVFASCLIRLLKGNAQPNALFALALTVSGSGLLWAAARLSKIFGGRTVTREILRLSPGFPTSCEFSVPAAIQHGRLLLFFETGADALRGEISVFSKLVGAQKKHMLTQQLQSKAIPLRIPSWFPVADRGATYWLRSWRTGGDFRPVVIELPEPVSAGTVLEMQLSVSRFSADAVQPKADGSKSLGLVLKETA